jgi:hypothetical protein
LAFLVGLALEGLDWVIMIVYCRSGSRFSHLLIIWGNYIFSHL